MKPARTIPLCALLLAACSTPTQQASSVPRPAIVPHEQWDETPPLGYPADATRRNIGPGGSLGFHDFKVDVMSTAVDSAGAQPHDVAWLRLSLGDSTAEKLVQEGEAFNWQGHHGHVVAFVRHRSHP